MAVLKHSKRLQGRDGEFGDASIAYEVTTPVVLHKLDAEIVADQGWKKEAGLVAEGDISSASADNPITIWVLRGGELPAARFHSVIAAHDPSPDPDPLDAVRTKLEKGEALTPEETTQTLRQLLLERN